MGNSTSALSNAVDGFTSSLSSSSNPERLYTVLAYEDPSKTPLWMQQRLLSVMKKIHHPYILHYVDSKVNTAAETMEIICERAVPLKTVLPELSAPEILLGLWQLCHSLHFLHISGGLAHGALTSLSLSAVYVVGDPNLQSVGTWLLGGLEFAYTQSECTPDFLKKCEQYVHSKEDWLSPEPNVDYTQCNIASRDILGLSKLIRAIYKSLSSANIQIPGDIDNWCRDIERKNAFQRNSGDIIALLQCQSIQSCPLVQIASAIRALPLLSLSQKRTFFQSLPSLLLSLPESLRVQRSLPLLLNTEVFSESELVAALPELLLPEDYAGGTGGKRGIFSREHFNTVLLPFLRAAFHLRHTAVRSKLLFSLEALLQCVSVEEAVGEWLPAIMMGLEDKNNKVVKDTVLSLRTLYVWMSEKEKSLSSISQPSTTGEGSSSTLTNVRNHKAKIIKTLYLLAKFDKSAQVRLQCVRVLMSLWGQIPSKMHGSVIEALHKSLVGDSTIVGEFLSVVKQLCKELEIEVICNSLLPALSSCLCHADSQVRISTANAIVDILEFLKALPKERFGNLSLPTSSISPRPTAPGDKERERDAPVERERERERESGGGSAVYKAIMQWTHQRPMERSQSIFVGAEVGGSDTTSKEAAWKAYYLPTSYPQLSTQISFSGDKSLPANSLPKYTHTERETFANTNTNTSGGATTAGGSMRAPVAVNLAEDDDDWSDEDEEWGEAVSPNTSTRRVSMEKVPVPPARKEEALPPPKEESEDSEEWDDMSNDSDDKDNFAASLSLSASKKPSAISKPPIRNHQKFGLNRKNSPISQDSGNNSPEPEKVEPEKSEKVEKNVPNLKVDEIIMKGPSAEDDDLRTVSPKFEKNDPFGDLFAQVGLENTKSENLSRKSSNSSQKSKISPEKRGKKSAVTAKKKEEKRPKAVKKVEKVVRAEEEEEDISPSSKRLEALAEDLDIDGDIDGAGWGDGDIDGDGWGDGDIDEEMGGEESVSPNLSAKLAADVEEEGEGDGWGDDSDIDL